MAHKGVLFFSMEKLYHFLWMSRMFGRKLTYADGAEVEVIDPGRHNTDSGPDFFNSKIKICLLYTSDAADEQ